MGLLWMEDFVGVEGKDKDFSCKILSDDLLIVKPDQGWWIVWLVPEVLWAQLGLYRITCLILCFRGREAEGY